ncbi:hypothetical protein [Acidovorax sp. SUPP3334]|uniref:hypothetical protein n=1 Tax=Acidovorax sp. SUPP3334 TaxID=2920881 RepID=UPI0023DE1D4F|nr:hypothetical protein [Acidovorax sp. SUPP3334]GKT24518.1 hypothetical protein AVHM3334_15020 [Acidovorax sp. SUPP3334]
MVKLSRTSFGFLALASRVGTVAAGFAAAFLRDADTFLEAGTDGARGVAFFADEVALAVSFAALGAAAGVVEDAAETSVVVGIDEGQINGIYSLYRFMALLAIN